MGSAAPSHRRWIVVLVLATGALLVALVPILDRADPSTLGPEATAEAGNGGSAEAGGPSGQVVTVALDLEEGWVVPDVDASAGTAPVAADGSDPAASDGSDPAASPGSDPAVGHSHGVPSLPVGSATVGVAVDIRRGSESFVIRSPVPRDLAFRAGTEERWGPWQPIGIGDDEAPDGNQGSEGSEARPPAATPVLIQPGSARIELVDRRGDREPVEIVFLPSFDGPGNGALDGPASPALASGDAPAIMSRSAWTSAGWASQNGSCGDGPVIADHLQAVVIHHTVTGNSYSAEQVDDLLRAIHYSHTEINGWCDIGYNFVVDRFGRIWEARTGSIAESVIGGHARGFNTGTVGVALLGQHHSGAWPPASSVSQPAGEAVEVLANWKLGAAGVDPNGRTWLRNRSSASQQRLAGETWHHVPTVLGHRDLGLTSCPGSHGMDLVSALPARLDARRDRSLPYDLAGWQRHDHGPAFAIADGRGGLRPAGAAQPWSGAPAGLGGSGTAIAVGGDEAGGYLLTSSGALRNYGSSPARATPTIAGGPVDLVVRSDGASGWVLDGTGVLRGFGGTADLTGGAGANAPVAAEVADDGRGYVLTSGGRLLPVGGLPRTEVSLAGGASAVDLTLNGPSAGWVLDETGKLTGFGGRADRQVSPAAPPVAVASAAPEPGGWVLDRHGQLWPFGGARYVFPVATDAGSGDAVDLDRVGLVYTAEFLASGDANYARRLHRLFLGRSASDAELDLMVTGLEQGQDRIDLTTELARSDHWAGSSLDRMYRDVLGREPDAEGRQYWMGQIASGLKIQDLGTYFYGSAEYAASAGSNEAYVRGLYQALLGRQPDGEGLAYWTGQLANGQARPPDVAAGFYNSIESRRDRVSRIYQQVFGTSPSPTQRDPLADNLPATGDVGLAAELAASSSFYRLAANDPEP